jgi:hypothetical protein
MSLLASLAQFAVKNNNTRAVTTPLHELSIEDARAKVTVVDSNKVKPEDGSQALALRLGRLSVALDVIAPDATRLNIAADQVEDVTSQLLEAVAAGTFDDAIIDAQLRSVPKPVVAELPAALDLAGLDDDLLAEESVEA